MKMTKRQFRLLILLTALVAMCSIGTVAFAGDGFTWQKNTSKDVGFTNLSTDEFEINSLQYMDFKNTSNYVLDFNVTLTQTSGVIPTKWSVCNYSLNSLYSDYATLYTHGGDPETKHVHLSPNETARVYIQGSAGKYFTLSLDLSDAEVDFGYYVPGRGGSLPNTVDLPIETEPSYNLKGEAFWAGDARNVASSQKRETYIYEFDLTKKTTITLRETIGFSTVKLDTETLIDHSTAEVFKTLKPGKHTIYVTPDSGCKYNIPYSTREYKDATGIEIIGCPQKVNRGQPITYTVKTVPADSDDKIAWVMVNDTKLTIPQNQNTVTGTFTVSGNDTLKIEAYTTNSEYESQTMYILPQAPVLAYENFTSSYDSVTCLLSSAYQSQILNNGTWSSFTGTATGLKPNTEYKVRTRKSDSSTIGTLYSDWSTPLTIITNSDKAPSIKSVKISNAKVSSGKHWIAGHFDTAGKWQPGYYYTASSTKFKVTIKLKKKPGTTGITVNGVRIKGNKKSYTLNTSVAYKAIGKKITLKIGTYNSTKYNNEGKTKSVKVKVKK